MSEEDIIKKAEYVISIGEPYMGTMTEYFIELYRLYKKEKQLNNIDTIDMDNYISKDKIKNKIKELENATWYCESVKNQTIQSLNELLEEE